LRLDEGVYGDLAHLHYLAGAEADWALSQSPS
jgi:hypothetical protein